MSAKITTKTQTVLFTGFARLAGLELIQFEMRSGIQLLRHSLQIMTSQSMFLLLGQFRLVSCSRLMVLRCFDFVSCLRYTCSVRPIPFVAIEDRSRHPFRSFSAFNTNESESSRMISISASIECGSARPPDEVCVRRRIHAYELELKVMICESIGQRIWLRLEACQRGVRNSYGVLHSAILVFQWCPVCQKSVVGLRSITATK